MSALKEQVKLVSSNGYQTRLDEKDTIKLNRLCDLYGPENLVRVSLLPNASASTDSHHPSGAAYEFASESPAFASPFHASSFMTDGTGVFRVVSGSIPATVRELEQAKADLKKLFAESRTAQSLSLAKRDPATNKDRVGSSYLGSLSSGNANGAEVALVRGTIDNEFENSSEEQAFIVVSASLPDLSRDLFQKIMDHQKSMPSKDQTTGPNIYTLNRSQKTTLKMSELAAWPELIYAEEAGRRNRAAIAAEVASILGVQILLTEDTAAGVPGTFIGDALSDVCSYSLQQVPNGNFVYFADALNTLNIRGFVPLKLAPNMGATLIRGRVDISHPIGTGWTNEWNNAFPASVGRRLPVNEAYSEVANNISMAALVSSPASPFCWSGSLAVNDKLGPATFNVRNTWFKTAETLLGRDPNSPEIHLRPVLVYLEGTPERKIF